MKRIVLVGPGNDIEQVHRIMIAKRPELSFCRPADPGAKDAEVAICWNPDAGSLGALPNLQLIHSVGAGAEQILQEPSRPAHVPVCRIIDPGHCQGMVEYVLWGVLHFHRHFDEVLRNQQRHSWVRVPQRSAQQTRVGVMGLGQLGKSVALQVSALGFETRGWSRSHQTLATVTTFQADELRSFLSGLDILICLLPLTNDTREILCADTFALLAKAAVVINCGRGGHLREEDLRQALASGQLRGALLDVFATEPLPEHSPLWDMPGVTVTPHIASSASFEVIAEQILANIERLESGEPLLNTVDSGLGY